MDGSDLKWTIMVEEKIQFLVELDDELLQGGAVISEWAAFLIRDADTSFVYGANLSSVIVSLAAIETCLRSEYDSNGQRFVRLISDSNLGEELKQELHALRVFRNKWVHVANPWDDMYLLSSSKLLEVELDQMARRSITALRRIIYSDPWV